MFIRMTQTRNAASGETYVTHRLVESRRVGGKVRQVTLLNLGRHFAPAKEHWPELCARIEQLLSGQSSLLTISESLERVAQHCVARLIAEGTGAPAAARSGAGTAAPSYAEVDPDSLALIQPRSIGVEHVALCALRELAFEPLLETLGINGVMRTAIVASIVARMAAPGSELASHRWLTSMSGLGDLLDVDLASLPLSVTFSVISVVTAEILTGVPGMGALLGTAAVTGNAALTFAVVITLAVVGIAITLAADAIRARVLHWWGQ